MEAFMAMRSGWLGFLLSVGNVREVYTKLSKI